MIQLSKRTLRDMTPKLEFFARKTIQFRYRKSIPATFYRFHITRLLRKKLPRKRLAFYGSILCSSTAINRKKKSQNIGFRQPIWLHFFIDVFWVFTSCLTNPSQCFSIFDFRSTVEERSYGWSALVKKWNSMDHRSITMAVLSALRWFQIECCFW